MSCSLNHWNDNIQNKIKVKGIVKYFFTADNTHYLNIQSTSDERETLGDI